MIRNKKQYFFYILLVYFWGLTQVNADSEKIVVELSYKSTRSSVFQVKKESQKKAKKLAIEKYIKRISPTAQQDKLNDICTDYPKYVKRVIQDSFFLDDNKQVTATYIVSLDIAPLNQHIRVKQLSAQAFLNIPIIILEMPTDATQINLKNAGISTNIQYLSIYRDIQQSIHDAITNECSKLGIQVQSLKFNTTYNSFKKTDPLLAGIIFDYRNYRFKENTALLKAIKEDPDYKHAITLNYRINHITFNRQNMKLSANISLFTKNLHSGSYSKSYRTGYSIKLNYATYDAVAQGGNLIIESIVSLLMKRTYQELNNMIAEAGHNLLRITITLNSKRSLYLFKNSIEKSCKLVDISLSDNTLTFQVLQKSDANAFVFENLYPLFEKHHITISENDIVVQSNQIQITQKTEVTVSNLHMDNTLLLNSDIDMNVNNLPLLEGKNENAIALIIGVEKYMNIPPSLFSKNDAILIDHLLRKKYNVQNTILLTNQYATFATIIAKINYLAHNIQNKDVYIFYSGHGYPTKGKNSAIVPYDTPVSMPDNLLITTDQMTKRINNGNPRNVYLFFDSCFSGNDRAGNMILADARPVMFVKKQSVVPKSCIMITATGENGKSYSHDNFQHGIFTYYLAKGLFGNADSNHNNQIETKELFNYLLKNVKSCVNKKGYYDQIPQFISQSTQTIIIQ